MDAVPANKRSDKEAEYDAQQLIDAMIPVGPYVLALDLSFFADPRHLLAPAPPCSWLIQPERARRCLLPLAPYGAAAAAASNFAAADLAATAALIGQASPLAAAASNGTALPAAHAAAGGELALATPAAAAAAGWGQLPSSAAFVAAADALLAAAFSRFEAPAQLPHDCLADFQAFRWLAESSFRGRVQRRLARRHPLDALGDMCQTAALGERHEGPLSRHRKDFLYILKETQRLAFIKRRVDTIRTFLRDVKKQLRPPSLVLLADANSTFSLPYFRQRMVREEVLQALRSLREDERHVRVLREQDAFLRSPSPTD